MKKTKRHGIAALALACGIHSAAAGVPSAADSGKAVITPPATEEKDWTAARPDGHAPIGVMADHMHHAGEWMLGYRYMLQHSEGLRQGDDSLSTNALFRTHAPNGDHYAVAPLEMDMQMHMLELMYAPTDYLTFMVMGNYMEMDMDMYGAAHHGGHGAGHGDAHGAPTHRSYSSHSVSGWSDTSFTTMVRLFNANRQSAHLQLGISAPTGDDGIKMGDTYTHYGMQLGSGTWDLLPGITYLGQADRLSWGAQYSAVLRLEEENDSGFRFGNVHQVTAWSAVRLNDWVSVSGRAVYRHEGVVRGHYNGPHNHSSPPDFQGNYGGDSVDLGVGMNFRVPNGPLKNQRLAVECLWPVYQDLNGVQLERDWTLYAGWQWAF